MERAGRCNLPASGEDPIVVDGCCGKYLVQALRYWNEVAKLNFKPLMQIGWEDSYENLPYTLCYSSVGTSETKGRNAILLLHDYNHNYEAHLVNSFDQLSDIVIRTPKLNQKHRLRILDRMAGGEVIPKYSGFSPKTYDGVKARLISKVLNKYFSGLITALPHQKAKWAGVKN